MKLSASKPVAVQCDELIPGSPRAQAVESLENVRAHFQALLQGNWSPGPTDDKYDAAVLPTLVAAENARAPGLNLKLLPQEHDFVNWLEAEKPIDARLMCTLPGFQIHKVVVDVRKVGEKTSVLVVEPQGLNEFARKKYEEGTLPALKKGLGSDVSVAILVLDTQQSTNDCRVFGLSAASKLHDNPGKLRSLHRQNVSCTSLKTSLGRPAEILSGEGRVRILDGKGVLPPEFIKHAQWRETLTKWRESNCSGRGNKAANDAAHGLLERFEARSTTRYEAPINAIFMK